MNIFLVEACGGVQILNCLHDFCSNSFDFSSKTDYEVIITSVIQSSPNYFGTSLFRYPSLTETCPNTFLRLLILGPILSFIAPTPFFIFAIIIILLWKMIYKKIIDFSWFQILPKKNPLILWYLMRFLHYKIEMCKENQYIGIHNYRYVMYVYWIVYSLVFYITRYWKFLK